MMGIKKVLFQWFIIFFDKRSSATQASKFAGSGLNDENMSN